MTLETRKVSFALAIVIGAVLTGLGPLLMYWGSDLRNRALETATGELKPPQIDIQKPFTLLLGSNSFTYSSDQLSQGIDIRRILDFGFDYPFQIRFEKGKLLVSVEVKNERGDIVAKIKDNNWTVSNNPILARDRNYNDYAFEVINSDNVPVIQVIAQGQNEIYLGGLFYDLNGWTLLITPEGMTYNPNASYIEKARRIFQYPSADHLGEMIANDALSQNILGTAILIIFLGFISIVVGAIILTLAGRSHLKAKPRSRKAQTGRTPRRVSNSKRPKKSKGI